MARWRGRQLGLAMMGDGRGTYNSEPSGSSVQGIKMSSKKSVATVKRLLAYGRQKMEQTDELTMYPFCRLIRDACYNDLSLEWPEYHHAELDCDAHQYRDN
jgi:hypothetical protein